MHKIASGIAICLLSVIALAAQDPAEKPSAPQNEAPPQQQQQQQQAQQPANPCPKIDVKAGQQLVRDGSPVKFTATLSGGDTKAQPIFSWSITAGTISGGQGTHSIEVDSTGAGADRAITASLMLGGLAPECGFEASSTVVVAAPAKKVDEYSALEAKQEEERLTDFFGHVTANDQAYVFAYGGRKSVRGQANTDARRIRAFAIKSGIPAERIMTLDGGYREEPAIELWIVPIGSEPPRASPTVNARDITFPKTTPAKRP